MAKRIMVIDDASSIRQVVAHVLKTEGYEVIEASDGDDALSKIDGEQIDLFVCDVNMPNMNGIEFVQMIKNSEKYSRYKFSPIMMLTTEAGEDMKMRGKEAGAKAWLVKPFQPDQLLAAIKKLII